MKFVYMVTTGTDDPTKASLPLHLATNGSVEVGHDSALILVGTPPRCCSEPTSIRCRASACRRYAN
jgi:hypothetical protein